MQIGAPPRLGEHAPRGKLEVGDIARTWGEALERMHPLWPEQRAALRAMMRCRTAQLGGHLDVCMDCGHSRPSYNSCRNRHCPKCQALSQARWVQARQERVLPVHYFHVVFTLPAELRTIAKANSTLAYEALFAAAAQTLLALGQDPKRLGGQLGITLVLHTWARDLTYHPHVHCIVTGGALSGDGNKWVKARRDFLFPVRVMAKLFRGKMLARLVAAHDRGKLRAVSPEEFSRVHRKVRRLKWVVYCKRPFGGPEQVIAYLGRYTHRVGISNNRLVSVDDRAVSFRTKNGATASATPVEFLRRLMQHVLAPGFTKIRHYGLMAASNATTKLEVARKLLQVQQVTHEQSPKPRRKAAVDWRDTMREVTGIDLRRCPICSNMTVVRQPLPIQYGRAPPRCEAA